MGTIESIQAWLHSGEESLLWLMLGIIALSYLLEDLAIVSAAGLATQGSCQHSMHCSLFSLASRPVTWGSITLVNQGDILEVSVIKL